MQQQRAQQQRVRSYLGKRIIYACVDYIEDGIDEEGELAYLVKECSRKYGVHQSNVYRWWRFYSEWGEIKPVI